MKHAGLQSSRYIDSIRENNDKGPKIKVGDIVRISKNLKLRTKKVKNTALGLMLLMILMEKKLLEHFTKKNCNFKNHIKNNLELKK